MKSSNEYDLSNALYGSVKIEARVLFFSSFLATRHNVNVMSVFSPWYTDITEYKKEKILSTKISML